MLTSRFTGLTRSRYIDMGCLAFRSVISEIGASIIDWFLEFKFHLWVVPTTQCMTQVPAIGARMS
jgi:hypothetical protein